MKIFVGMPSGSGSPKVDVIMNIKDQIVNDDVEIVFNLNSIVSGRPVHIARNELVKRFLETDCDYLWRVDDDNPPNKDVLQLLLDANKDIISALVPLRHGGYLLNVFKDGKNLTSLKGLDDVFEVENAGTGCLLMKREVVEEVTKETKWYPFQFKVINGEETSEDIYFGKVAKRLKYKYYAHKQAKCTHYTKDGQLLKVKMDLSIIIPTLMQKNDDGEVFYDKIIKNINDLNLDMEYEIITIKDKLVNEAWNEGVERACGKYVMIINDDIIIKEGTIESLIQTCDHYGISCPYFTCKNDFEEIRRCSYGGIVGFAFMMNRDAIKRCFPIPGQLKIRFGDNRIREKNDRKFVWAGLIHHFESKTLLSPEHRERINNLIEQDKKERALLTNPETWKQ